MRTFRREWHRQISASATLPTDVHDELPLLLQFFHRDIFDEQPQHSLAILCLRSGRMP
jgi:hypothetical protein